MSMAFLWSKRFSTKCMSLAIALRSDTHFRAIKLCPQSKQINTERYKNNLICITMGTKKKCCRALCARGATQFVKRGKLIRTNELLKWLAELTRHGLGGSPNWHEFWGFPNLILVARGVDVARGLPPLRPIVWQHEQIWSSDKSRRCFRRYF